MDDLALATRLLNPFAVEQLRPAHAAALAGLAERYGDRWTADLLRTVTFPQSVAHRRRQLTDLGEPLAAALLATTATQATALLDRIIRYCRDHGEELGPCVMVALRAAVAAARTRQQQFAPIATDQADRLRARLARPTRPPTTGRSRCPAAAPARCAPPWAISWPTRPSRTLDWPLAQDRRSHVHSRIDQADLPVTHKTRRQGRPYVLVLTKTAQLFDREAKQRAKDNADLLWLADHW